MDFALSTEQELLRKEVRHFLETECPKKVVKELQASELGYSPEMWDKMADLGWLGLVIPEEYGGVGGNLVDLAVLFEEIGRAACPSPLFSTVVFGVLPLLQAGDEGQRQQFLPRVAGGDCILSMALEEPEAAYDPRFMATRASARGRGFAISGTKLFVQNAHIANRLFVVARTHEGGADGSGLTVFVMDGKAPGVSITPLPATAGDKQFEVTFDNVSAPCACLLGDADNGWALVESTLRHAVAMQCVQIVGVMQQELEMTAGYASQRVQFDRPIASFQAVQHRLADMYTDVEGSRWIAYQAAWRLSQKLPAAREVAMAKAWCGEACQRVAYAAQHLHGGIGMDMDYDLHYYFEWAKSLQLNLGSPALHRLTLEAMEF